MKTLIVHPLSHNKRKCYATFPQGEETANRIMATIQEGLEDDFELEGLREKLETSNVVVGGQGSLEEITEYIKSTHHDVRIATAHYI